MAARIPCCPRQNTLNVLKLDSMPGPPIPIFTERVSTRITPEARRAAEEAARGHGWTLSDWLRVVVDVATEDLQRPRRRARLPRRPGT
jgi:hypothetical protein